jgi:LPXTG-motif cell wall-anchored protein
MKSIRLLVIPLLLLLLQATMVFAADETTVQVRQDPQLGTFLTDEKGMTLYLFKKDALNNSVCYDACAKAWPPFTDPGYLTLPSGVGGTLGTIVRKDGTKQVTYNGVPLYYYAPDKSPGDVKGQGVGNVWFVVAAQPAVSKLPATGGIPMGIIALAGLSVAGAGTLLRRR